MLVPRFFFFFAGVSAGFCGRLSTGLVWLPSLFGFDAGRPCGGRAGVAGVAGFGGFGGFAASARSAAFYASSG